MESILSHVFLVNFLSRKHVFESNAVVNEIESYSYANEGGIICDLSF